MGINVRAMGISVLLAFALYYTYGQFSLGWITILPIVFALAICALPVPKFFTRHQNSVALTILIGYLAVAACSLLPSEGFLRSVIVDVADQRYLPWMRGLFGIAAAAIIASFFLSRYAKPRVQLVFFAVACGAMIAAFGLTVPTSPRAEIDVWTVHEEGAAAFIEGKNPYTVEYTNIYPEELRAVLTPGGVTYSYLPGTFMWMAPWKALGLDTRYSQLVTRLLTAVLLFLIAWRARGRLDFLTYVPALFYLSFPLNTFFVVRAWNDDISIMFYALAAWALIARRPWALFLACNCLLILKHHAIFFVPLIIWFTWQIFRERWPLWRVVLMSTFAAAVIHAGYLLADWRNYLGSLYGLTFLKFPGVHHVFPDRRDPFSLMNYLHLYVGYKNSWVFPLVMLIIAGAAVRAVLRKTDLAVFLRALAAMSFALFIFGPIAFANYYQFALAMMLIAWAASLTSAVSDETWEVRTDWWLIAYVTTRSVILFIFSWLIVETRYFHSVADMISAGRWPYVDFGYNFLPFSLIPALIPAAARSLTDESQSFLAYHTLFQLVVLVFDIVMARWIFERFRKGRISVVAMTLFIFGPLFVAPLYLASATLVTAVGIYLLGLAALFAIGRRRLTWILDRRRTAFFVCLSFLAIAAAAAFGLSEWGDLDLTFDPMLSPSAILIWVLTFLPLILGRGDWPKERGIAKAAGLCFFSCLGLTFFLLLEIEAVADAKPFFAALVWARNALLAIWLLLFIFNYYRVRIAAHDV